MLVVEDDASTADYIAKGLREERFTVEQVADGRDALYAATSSEFDASRTAVGRPTAGYQR